MPRLFLVDGTALAYRSHFALQRQGFTAPDGSPVGATWGFARTLHDLLDKEKPDRIAVAFDPPGPTFRHERFAPYKATREKMPDEIGAQLELLREVVRGLGIPVYEVKGFEADDVIGTLATQGAAAGWEVLIVTGDKDFLQLVDERVRLYNVFKTGVPLAIEGAAESVERLGVPPERVIDMLAIMGDASDNVPGVKGIGEKGALKLLTQFESVDGLIAHLDEIPGKAGEAVRRDKEQMLLSRELVTIARDVPLEPTFERIGPPTPDTKRLVRLYQRLGFSALLARASSAVQASEERAYTIVRDRAALEAMIAELRGAGRFAVDTETTSLFPLQAEIVGASFACKPLAAWYVPFNLDPPVLPGGKSALIEALRPLLEDPSLERVGQNTKYDWLVFAHHGLRPPPPAFDTMVASFCAAGSTRRHNLDDLALRFLDLQKIPTTALIGTGRAQITMDQVPVEKVGEYACEDADCTMRLVAPLAAELKANHAEQLFHELEMPLVPVLFALEERGIKLDVAALAESGRIMEGEIATAVARIHELAGGEFNVNSTKALGEVLFEKLQIHVAAGVKRPKRTQTGYSTDAATLEQHYAEVPIVQALLDYREIQKLKSTYVDTLPGYVNPDTGRIHCSFSQVSAATGRLASSDPNLQNIPVRSARGRELRRAFVARATDERGAWILLSADYSQVELRILAHLSGDPGLVRAFAEGHDVHAATAATVFGVAPTAVTREMRSRAKAINFGLLYGMGAPRLARDTGMTIPEARQFIERYFDSFPRVRGWIEQTLSMAREQGYVETLSGRRRRFPEFAGTDARAKSFAENAAVNTPVQGSAADVIKRAMIVLEERFARSKLAGRMLLQVHDELVFELPERELEPTRELVREVMEHAWPLDVPLAVEFGHGANWLDAH